MSPETSGHRAEILEVAKRMFMTRGYRGVSTREIAEAVGITQPALYHHFGGKEALYMAVLEDELSRQSEAMAAACRLDASATGRLEALATAIARRSEYDMSQMFHDLRFEISDENRRRIGAAFRDAMLQPMVSVLEDMEREGAIASAGQTRMSLMESAMFVLAVIRMLTEGAGGPAGSPARAPSEIGWLTVRLVTSGLGPRPEENPGDPRDVAGGPLC